MADAPADVDVTPDRPAPSGLREIAWVFLKLGFTAFGGPAAHVAMMEDEVVRRRAWMTRGEFLDLYGATNLIPGPNSTEMAIHVGRSKAGWAGILVAGSCFIVPAASITLGLAWAYVRFGALPQAAWLLYGVKPVIIAVVLQALFRLGRAAVKTRHLAALSVALVTASALGVNEIALLFGAGALATGMRPRGHGNKPQGPASAVSLPLAAAAGSAGAVGVAAAPFGLVPLFLFFLKVGAVLFGSGYVLLAFLRADLVDRWGWLTEAQLLDAVAIGQLTPGPVSTTATFIGYVLGGGPGALVATLGIFLPSFFFVAVSGPLVPRLRRSAAAGAFLDGVNVASLALMVVVTARLGRAALVDAPTVLLAAGAAVLLLRWRVNSLWLILAGIITGFVVHQLR